jgi:F-type H+-transporting ATPase subunit b
VNWLWLVHPAQVFKVEHMATTTETHTEAEGGAHKAAFPPLDSKTFPSQIFWLVIFFGALYLLMSRLVLPRIASILETRKNRIDGDIARASALKDETEAALNSYNKALADARGNASDIAKSTRDTVNADVASKQHKLDAELSAKAVAAEAAIAKSKAKAMESVSSIASDTASEIVAALTGGRVTKAALAKALKG